MDTFADHAFPLTVGQEGAFDNNAHDRGNWTGGIVGRGTLTGTKYGISAAAYPMLDIEHLTLADAEVIYRRDYWTRLRCDELPPAIAVLVFDAAVNNGCHAAAVLLQRAVGTAPDGVVGPATIAAAAWVSLPAALREFQAQRNADMAALPSWATFGLGWSRRLFSVFAYALLLPVK